MSLAILFHFLCTQHVSGINISIIRSLRLFCWTTTLVVFLVRCVLEFRCGWDGVVSVLPAEAQLLPVYFTSYVLSMFRALIYPSSGACDYSVELPHWSYSWFDVLEFRCGWDGVVSVLPAEAQLLPLYFTSYVISMFRALIYPSSGACDYSVELPHWSYCSWFDVCWSFGVVGLEWYRTKNNTTNVVFYSSTLTMMHGPINIRYGTLCVNF